MIRPRHLLPLVLLAACNGDKGLIQYNAPPTVSISNPPDGSAYNEGDTITFTGQVGDDTTPAAELFLQWSSNPGGILSDTTVADSDGQVVFTTASLPAGNPVITLAATDGVGDRSEVSITITVHDVPDAPEINVVRPGNGESGQEGVPFLFQVQVSDAQDAPEALTVTFESDLEGGVFCSPTADATGLASCEYALGAGTHHLIFRVADTTNLTAQVDWYFGVTPGTDVDDDDDGWTERQGDCDDTNPSVNPGEEEVYNGVDDDCDGVTDEGTTGYDDDRDGWTELDGDCDDDDAATYPGAPETCDGRDNDCDVTIDEGTSCYDDDGDGWTENAGDCNDASGISYPGGTEIADGLDNDCDGYVDEGTSAYDDDGDGWTEDGGDCNDGNRSINPGAAETCNGSDDDCDASVDESGASGCSTYYLDSDGDGYGNRSYSACLCSPSGSYTSAYGTDCYDSNASANPAATSWYSSPRGDTSYDYNCDGTESHYYNGTGECSWDLFSCSTPSSGWSGGRDPGCGGRGSYVTDCYACGFLYTECCETTSTYTQYCH